MTVSEPTQIKGSTFKLRMDFVQNRWGAEGVEAVLRALPAEESETVRSTLPSFWYPLALNAKLDETICHVLAEDDPEVFLDLGEYSAAQLAERIYVSYFDERKPERFLELTRELYRNYYRNGGRRRNEFPRPGQAELFVEGSPEAYRSNCMSNVGFIRRSLVLLGVKNVDCFEVACASRGEGANCHARVLWTP